jgi:hypothetical protein
MYMNHMTIDICKKYVSLDIIMEDYVVIGGNLNFTWNRSKVWGTSARVERLEDFFRYSFEQEGFIDAKRINS